MRRSVSLPARVARNVRAIAKNRNMSTSRVLVELIETGLSGREAEKQRFFAVAKQLSETTDAAERERLTQELARLTFGE